MTVFLLDQAPVLLTEDLEYVIDADVLEKCLPSLEQLGTSFTVVEGTLSRFRIIPGFNVREEQLFRIAELIASSDRAFVFS